MKKQWAINEDALLKTIILLGLVFFLLSSIRTEEISLYIHPRFTNLILFTTGVLVILAIVQAGQLFNRHHHMLSCGCGHEHGPSTWLYVPFAVTLLIAFALPSSNLDAGVVLNKGLNSRVGASALSLAQKDNRTTPAELVKMSRIAITDANFVAIVSELVKNPDPYTGKEIVFTGFVFRDTNYSPSQIALVRYAVTCCSADAAPFGLICVDQDADKYKLDTWYTITGIIDVGEHRNMKVPIVRVTASKPILTPPKSPYVYQ